MNQLPYPEAATFADDAVFNVTWNAQGKDVGQKQLRLVYAISDAFHWGDFRLKVCSLGRELRSSMTME